MKRIPPKGPLRPLYALIAMASALALALSAHAGECVREDQSVRVAGHVSRQRITRLDDRAANRTVRDTVVTLALRDPLCVMLPDDVNLSLRPRQIREVQLLHPERLPNGRDTAILLDGRVRLASSNAHHHPVLVDIAGLPTTRNSAPVVAPAPVGRNTTLAVARFNH